MFKYVSIVVCIAHALASSNASAFDKERNGFLIGLGVGGQYSSIDAKDTSDPETSNEAFIDDDFTEFSPSFSFRIGGGLARKVTLYYLTTQTKLNSDVRYNFNGIGASYYFRDSSPSFYLHGSVGLGLLDFKDWRRGEEGGRTITIGVGLEPVQGLHLDLGVTNLDTDDSTTHNSDYDDVEYEVFITQFTVGYTWF